MAKILHNSLMMYAQRLAPILTAFFLISFPFVSFASDEFERQCQALRQFHEANTAAASSPRTALTQLFAKNADVFIILDEHSTHETETIGEDLLESLRSLSASQRPDCLLLEKDPDPQFSDSAMLTKFFSGDDHALDSVSDVTRVMRWNGDKKSLIEFFKSLRSMGIKAIPVDKQQTSGTVPEILNSRDQAMSENIKSLYQSRVCKKSVFSVGAMHGLDHDAGDGRKTIIHWLRQFNLSTKTILFSIAGKLSVYPKGVAVFPNQNSAFGEASWHKGSFVKSGDLSPLICRSSVDVARESYAFFNNRTVDSPMIYFPDIEEFLGMPELGLPSPNRDGFFGRMSDVDLVWIHSCRESQCRNFNRQTHELLINSGFDLY